MYNDIYLKEISQYLINRKETVAMAESVTAGHLQSAFSLAENALSFFQGGITTYNIGQKCRHLGIEPTHALSCNCVSERVAGEMALQAAILFLSDWGLAITGYATPVPGVTGSDLYAYYAISYQQKIQNKGMISTTDSHHSALEVQVFYTDQVLSAFLKLLCRNERVFSLTEMKRHSL